MKKIIFLVVLVIIFVLAYLAFFGDYESVAKELIFDESRWDPALIVQMEGGPHYLSHDLTIDIAPPPLSSSIKTAEEVTYLRMLEEQRTPEQETSINSQISDIEVRDFFLKQAGIDPVTKPLTLLLMKEVMNEAGFYILREKWRFQRARPYDVDPALAISITPPPHSSYPSGHGGQSWAVAIFLSEFDPKKSNLWFKVANSIGHNREIAGVHYPSDTKAGQLLSDQVMEALLDDAKFMEKLEQVRTLEW